EAVRTALHHGRSLQPPRQHSPDDRMERHLRSRSHRPCALGVRHGPCGRGPGPSAGDRPDRSHRSRRDDLQAADRNPRGSSRDSPVVAGDADPAVRGTAALLRIPRVRRARLSRPHPRSVRARMRSRMGTAGPQRPGELRQSRSARGRLGGGERVLGEPALGEDAQGTRRRRTHGYTHTRRNRRRLAGAMGQTRERGDPPFDRLIRFPRPSQHHPDERTTGMTTHSGQSGQGPTTTAVGHAQNRNLALALTLLGTLVVIGTYIAVLLTQPMNLGIDLGHTTLWVMLGYLFGGLLLAAGTLPLIPRSVLALIPVAIALNIVIGQIIGNYTPVPLYLDSIGTVMIGVLAGPAAGAFTGIVSNLIWGV